MEARNCLAACVLMHFILAVSAIDKRMVYIVFVESLPQHPYSLAFHYSELLKDIVPPSFARKSLLRSYTNFNGFSAKLTEKEAYKLRMIQFQHHNYNLKQCPFFHVNHLRFAYNTALPAQCLVRKIIGARSYITHGKDLSARDNNGHGSHVASIAAGRNVRDASFYGIAQGIAKGGVPSARLAVYKVCDHYCYSADIMAAFDDAISDGVDFISISISFNESFESTSNPIALGALHAYAKGILTINAAGNGGPALFSITTDAPWILTVAASGTDRQIVDKVLLGKYATLVGNGINAFPSRKGGLPIVYGTELSSTCSESDARNCSEPCLVRSSIDQKVVLCDKVPKLKYINITGVPSFITPNMEENVSKIEPYPVVRLSTNELNLVKTYIDSTTEPKVQILKSEAIHNPGAPFVAVFSARGPSTFIPDIVKPDVTAPGVEILAAFSPLGSPSDSPFDKRPVNYNILSGTSMACPHVTAAAVYVKSIHPNWSPSAIKSALMTTAREFNPALYPEAEFAYGSGHIDPLKAKNPGLVYETPVEEYFKIWCNISRIAGSFTVTNASCPTQLTLKDINYPSMSVRLDMKDVFTVSFPRTVTNVGRANSTYVAYIEGDQSRLHFIVEPSTLQFTELNQKINFVVTVKGKRMKPETLKRVSLVWTDGVHMVRSPIVVYTGETTSAGGSAQTPSAGGSARTPSAGGSARTPSWFCLLSVMLIIMVTLY
ncbi:subtilisin-like protease SBT4.3 [Artemisia annua]|uniref:Subtilisin-like protease SBT4.3 n=1 Tax=Artemisia annua TaxID=35608 RepID=A0A2U1MLA6_ARTAN|nr:subtilisin-like protease SBT4.3 [Artemisia annua]